MNRFSQRSSQAELIDAPGIPFSDWETCLRELNTVNTFLGGHRITVEGVKKLFRIGKPTPTIAEIGCGGGDNLKAINRWRRGLRYIGIDLNAACIAFAQRNCSDLQKATFICSDYKNVEFGDKRPDIIFSSLFCHHFSDQQLVDMLTWLKTNAAEGFFINDLQRHPVAFHSIKILTRIFSRSYLVKNDAPVSVMRGFKRKEWELLLQRAGITRYLIKWKWAFRYLIVVNNKHDASAV